MVVQIKKHMSAQYLQQSKFLLNRYFSERDGNRDSEISTGIKSKNKEKIDVAQATMDGEIVY